MGTIVTIVHCVTCVLLVLVVLIQSGKGAEISASFGGSSQTVFGSSGGANFFTKFTSIAAGIFMVTSIVLTIMGSQARKSVFEGAAQPVPASTQSATETIPQPAKPAAPGAQNAPAEQKK